MDIYKRNTVIALASLILIVAVVYVARSTMESGRESDPGDKPADAAAVPNEFKYSFSVPGRLAEAASMKESTSPYWWLDSGGYLEIASSTGQTIHGVLPDQDRWRRLYSRNNPLDTGDGRYPQNVFRLISRNVWSGFSQEIYFKVDAYNGSASPNRNESNGLLLFGRYQDGENLYYAGARVDGHAIIKKKKNGIYYTMASKKILEGKYDPVTSPNLLPLDKWMGVRMEIGTTTSSDLKISLYTDIDGTGKWNKVLEAIDDGISYGGPIIPGPAYVGVRTDFMDVSFREYEIRRI